MTRTWVIGTNTHPAMRNRKATRVSAGISRVAALVTTNVLPHI